MMEKLNVYAYWQRRHWREMRKRASRRSAAVACAMDDIPAQLERYWTNYGPSEFPGMPTTAETWAWSVRGLLTYFAIASTSNEQTVLPSRAADSVWHAWLAWDAEHLRRFQLRHFQKEMPHVETKDMPATADVETALPRTWALASKYDGNPVLSGSVPFLFVVDRVVDMPQGWHYEHNSKTRQVEVADIGAHGLRNSRVVPGLTAVGFLALGLIAAEETHAWQQQATRGTDSSASTGGGSSGSSCGVGMPAWSCGSGSSDGGSSGGDGGSSSSSSCGSSCGGGGGCG